MATYIALLRAVNVGGKGKLPMADLKALCGELGFSNVATYIASGNVIFESRLAADKVQAQLEKKLLAYAEKVVAAFVRSAEEMRTVLENNPFGHREPRLTHAFFLQEAAAPNTVTDISGNTGEEIRLGRRVIYVYYPLGMGQSKLRIPAVRLGTARNLNTVAKLVEMSSQPA